MTDNKSHITETQLMQFLLGEASAEQMQQIEKWLHASAENQMQLDKLESIWLETGKLVPSPVAVDMKLAWETLSLRVDDYEKSKTHKGGKVLSMNQKIIRIAMGAAAIFLVAFGLFKIAIEPNIPIDQLVFSSTEKVFKATLPDGSEIALNLNSTLTYPEKFSKQSRNVELEGEAFFQVEHNPKQPFTIKAGNANIKVLGTSFNVKAIKDSDVEVSVSTGRVQLFSIDSITGDTASVLLAAGQKGVLPHSGSAPVKLESVVEPDEMFWMDRTLVFKQIELSKVIQMLEKYYKVNVTIENQMALTCSYTATFTDADIDTILAMLATTFNFELTGSEPNYVLKGNGCLDD